MCGRKFQIVAQEMQENLVKIVNEQVGRVEADLQLLSDENTILESERDLHFRKRVEEGVERARER
jgi:hypothetical protein